MARLPDGGAGEKELGSGRECPQGPGAGRRDFQLRSLVRGFFHVKNGNYDLAQKDWKVVLEEHPNDLDKQSIYAALLVRLGDQNGYREICQSLESGGGGKKTPRGR